jgi:hypothetical protein
MGNMSETPARRGWRGEAAGIPAARTLVPSTAQPAQSAQSTQPALPIAPPPAAPAAAAPAGFAAPTARRPSPGRTPPAAPDNFPLWPTTSTVALHETGAATTAAAGVALARTDVDGPADEAAHEAAHEAGRAAVLDHLAGRPEAWPPPAMHAMRRPRDDRRTAPPPHRQRRIRRVRPPRGPVAGLTAMLLLGLLAGFFAWTSAEPFWLDMGHGVRGTAEITACKGTGLTRRCVADFAAPGRDRIDGARVMGLDGAPGDSVAAQMLPGGRIAYAGNESGLRARWAAGLGLIALCGIVLAWVTGAWRFGRLRDRLTAWSLTALAPLILGAAVIAAAY